MGDLELFGEVHRCAGRLLAVAQGRVEHNQSVVVHGQHSSVLCHVGQAFQPDVLRYVRLKSLTYNKKTLGQIACPRVRYLLRRHGSKMAAYPGRSPWKEEIESHKDLIEVVHHGRCKSSS